LVAEKNHEYRPHPLFTKKKEKREMKKRKGPERCKEREVDFFWLVARKSKWEGGSKGKTVKGGGNFHLTTNPPEGKGPDSRSTKRLSLNLRGKRAN